MNSKLLHQVSNHPVHLQNEEKKLSPSAMIPFCEFGKNSRIMGIMIDEFHVPVCNSFQAKILNDQLCYEVDLNKFKNYFSAENLKKGFTFFVDNNEDRQYSWISKIPKNKEEGKMSNVKPSIHQPFILATLGEKVLDEA